MDEQGAFNMTPEQWAQFMANQGGGEGGFQETPGAFGGGISSSQAPGQQSAYSGRGLIDLGGFGPALQAASFAPGPIGLAASLANAGVRANNLGVTNSARQNLGMPGLSFGQMLGGMFGLNDYGSSSGFLGDTNIGGRNYGVSMTGDVIGGRTTLDPTEAANRSAMAGIHADNPQGFGGGQSTGLGETGGAFGGVEGYGGMDEGDRGRAAGIGGGGTSGSSGSSDSDSDSGDSEGGGGEDGGGEGSGAFARGGYLNPQGGAFIIPADVVSGLGNGSTSAGARQYRKYGGELIKGRGDGRSDHVKAGAFNFSDGEVYIPPAGVRKAGGADKLRQHVLETRKNTVNTMRNLPPPKG